MTYAISDLHGRYDKYVALLKTIGFSEKDTLYVLGDVCDRGPQSAEIYQDMMQRGNVYPTMGNHEHMLLGALPQCCDFLADRHERGSSLMAAVWRACGGEETLASLQGIGEEDVAKVYDYVCSFPLYRVAEVCQKCYLLVHAGLQNYERTKPLEAYAPRELLQYGFDFDGTYYPFWFDKIIVGHTPTFQVNPCRSARIYHGKGNVINVDCGAVFNEGGKLGCLCLETMEEIYV